MLTSSSRTASRTGFAAAMLALLLVQPLPRAWAGIGFAESGPALLDTRNPVLELEPISEHLVLHAGDHLLFSWTSFDDNPGTDPDDFQATVTIESAPDSNLSWYQEPGGFDWDWIAPETQSAQCRLEVTVTDVMGNTTSSVSNYFTVLYSATPAPDLPDRFHLGFPAPNPFNPACRLEFSLPEAGRVTCAVHDLRGHRVRLLVSGHRDAGSHTVRWDGTDDEGRPQPGGLYFFVLEARTSAGPRRLTRQAVLIP